MTSAAFQIEQTLVTGALQDQPAFANRFESWPIEKAYLNEKRVATEQLTGMNKLTKTLQTAKWPEKTVYFISDVHADAEAFVASLILAEAVVLNPSGQMTLTEKGQSSQFVIGGDCLDKGPSNLRLLRAIKALMACGGQVKLLAGNHDIRLFMGLRTLSKGLQDNGEHLFVRMGLKVIPLLVEVFQEYQSQVQAQNVPTEKHCKALLYPSPKWFKRFPKQARGLLSVSAIETELKRIRKKMDTFEYRCREAGLSLQDVYATVQVLQNLFLEPDGEFAWFFHQMELLHQEGAFLFLHAGVDDEMAGILETRSVDEINAMYRKQLNGDLFHFYYGPLANTIRTKYRQADRPLTSAGVGCINRMGIHFLVHGHRNCTRGQRIVLREGLFHVEGDVTLDRNSRRKEGLSGVGAGITIIHPKGQLIGISTDYPFAKVFDPKRPFG